MKLVLHGIEDFQVAREETLRNPVFTASRAVDPGTFDGVIATTRFAEGMGCELWNVDPGARARSGVLLAS